MHDFLSRQPLKYKLQYNCGKVNNFQRIIIVPFHVRNTFKLSRPIGPSIVLIGSNILIEIGFKTRTARKYIALGAAQRLKV